MNSDPTPREQLFLDALDQLTLPTKGREADIIGRVQRAIASASARSPAAGDVFAERYKLERELGEGGMGVVWLARDRQLDRDVAVKILTGVGDSAALARMRREARAVAQIAHPNVAAVFDVDVDARPPFIVMEYVEGGDLRRWLRREPAPRWQAIVEAFEQAGAGLAAAHRVGLVHRDFKPGNVLVGNGRIRVADFGLARSTAGGGRADSTAIDGSIDATLTQSGVAIGTPAYMAPEQHDGGVVTPAADIFAFACSLYEGLYGPRPYAGSDWAQLARAKAQGPPVAPPDSDVPSRVYAVIARGLAADPDERWRSMRAFVSALRRVHRRSRLGWVAGAVAAAGVVALVWPPSMPRNDCAAEIEAFEFEAKAQQRALASELGQSTATPALRDVTARALDEFRTKWVAAWSASCEGETPLIRSDARMACLRQVRRSAAEQLGRAAEGSQEAQRFAGRLHHFPTVAECEDAVQERLQPLPADLDLRLEIEELQAWARSEVDRKDDAAESRSRIERAHATGHLPTLAVVQLATGMREYRNGDTEAASVRYVDAYRTALEGGADWVAYRAAKRCTIVSSVLGKVDDARRWDSTAGALHAKLGVDPSDRIETRAFLASGLARAGALQEARDLSAELYEQSLEAPEHRLEVIVALGEIGHVSIWLDDFAQGVQRTEEALRRAKLYYANDIKLITTCEGKLANAYRYVERYDEAEALYEQVLARRLGPEEHLITVLNYSQLLGDQPARLPDARALLDEARKDLEARGREESLDFANLLSALGQVEFKAKRPEQARASLERAREIYAKQLGSEHIRIQNVDEWLAKLDAGD